MAPGRIITFAASIVCFMWASWIMDGYGIPMWPRIGIMAITIFATQLQDLSRKLKF